MVLLRRAVKDRVVLAMSAKIPISIRHPIRIGGVHTPIKPKPLAQCVFGGAGGNRTPVQHAFVSEGITAIVAFATLLMY